MNGTYRWKRLVTVLVATLLSFGLSMGEGALETVPVAWATGPCDNIDWGPRVPSPPEPNADGQVLDADTGQGIQGATVELYQCTSSGAQLWGTDTTDALGAYAFEDLDTGYGYYAAVAMTGVMTGKTPADGTDNPSAAYGVLPAIVELDFAFD